MARFETHAGEPIPASLAAFEWALEAAGVEFLPNNGVKLKLKAQKTKRRKPEGITIPRRKAQQRGPECD